MPKNIIVGGKVYVNNDNIVKDKVTCDSFENFTLKVPNLSTVPTIDETSVPVNMTGFRGGVLGNNGKIYCVPYADRSTSVGIIDPKTNTFDSTSIRLPEPVASRNNKWVGGVLAPNGEVYCGPFNETNILVINTFNNTIRFIESPVNKCRGGTLGPNGVIYFTRERGDDEYVYFLKIDTKTDTVSTISNLQYINTGYMGCCLGPDSNIYTFPRNSNSSNIAVLDYSSDTVSFPSWLEPANIKIRDRGMAGGTLGYNSNIYVAPLVTNGGGVMIELDPINKGTNVYSFNSLNGSGVDVTQWTAFTGAVNGKDDNIYFIPRNRNNVCAVVYINTRTRTLKVIPRTRTGGYFGGVLAPNGYIYCIPDDVQCTHSLIIKPTIQQGTDWPIGPVFNKF